MANPGKWQDWDKAARDRKGRRQPSRLCHGRENPADPARERNEKEARIITENFIEYYQRRHPEKDTRRS